MDRMISGRNAMAGAAGLVAVTFALLWTGAFVVMPMWLVTALVVGAVCAVAFAIWDVVHEHRHSATFREFAALHGWEYRARSHAYTHRFETFPFNQGTARHQRHILTGTLGGIQCATFSHHFRADSDERSSRDQVYQVTLVELPVALPRLDVVPEGVAIKAVKALGGMDVDVESHEFNRRYRVRAGDRKYAHAVLDPRMVERLIQPDTAGMAFRIEGGAVIMWRAGRLGTDDLVRRLGILAAIARRIPQHVVREYLERGFGRNDGERPMRGPDWATRGGVLNSRTYTGIEPGPRATGEGWRGLPTGDGAWDIFGIRSGGSTWPSSE